MTKLSAGTAHEKIAADMYQALANDASTQDAWESLTPLARNEWICWVEEARRSETRVRRIARMVTELAEGMRRPCCWIGCIHLNDKAISPSVRGILEKRARGN